MFKFTRYFITMLLVMLMIGCDKSKDVQQINIKQKLPDVCKPYEPPKVINRWLSEEEKNEVLKGKPQVYHPDSLVCNSDGTCQWKVQYNVHSYAYNTWWDGESLPHLGAVQYDCEDSMDAELVHCSVSVTDKHKNQTHVALVECHGQVRQDCKEIFKFKLFKKYEEEKFDPSEPAMITLERRRINRLKERFVTCQPFCSHNALYDGKCMVGWDHYLDALPQSIRVYGNEIL